MLQGEGCGRQKTVFVQSEVVGTGPQDEGRRADSCRQLVGQREVGEEEGPSASMCLHMIALLSCVESGAQLTLIVQQQVLGIVNLLEELGGGTVI